jgi:radical SAM protein with 4Fe4S-binding SPASM domain
LGAELGVEVTVDPTITPRMDGDRALLDLNIDQAALQRVFREEGLIENTGESCAPPSGPDDEVLDSLPCSAGHTACYVSPYGDVYPCVQFPLPSGNVRNDKFLDIWRHSPQLKEVRSITLRDLTGCSHCSNLKTCTRCPGLAYMEGNMRGPSIQDCEKSFVRTGIPSVNLMSKKSAGAGAGLVQIQSMPAMATAASA